MRTLKTSEAAALLNVSPNTLRAWEQRFGYPRPQRSPGRHRLYAYAEIDALRQALHGGLSTSSAVSVARESVTADVPALVSSLTNFKGSRADSVMEATLAIGSLESAVEGLLLEGLQTLLCRKGPQGASWEYGLSWAIDWLRRAQRLLVSSEHRGTVLIGEAFDFNADIMLAYSRALALFCTRSGLDTVTLPVRASGALHEAVAAIEPDLVVVAGPRADDAVGRWIYSVCSAHPILGLAYYLRRETHAPVATVLWLPNSPTAAQQVLGKALDQAAASAPVQQHNGDGIAAHHHRDAVRLGS